MPSFQDSIFIFLLALILFGPKKLPEMARWVGKLMAEFRRASNEFRIQMEDELRIAEQAETQKKLAAAATTEVAAPAVAAEATTAENAAEAAGSADSASSSDIEHTAANPPIGTNDGSYVGYTDDDPSMRGEAYLSNAHYGTPEVEEPVDPYGQIPAQADSPPQPIATSGELSIHAPESGLPVPAHTAAETSESNKA